MYTPAQVSDMLSIPPSTLRRLSSEFSEFLSKQKTRNRKYNESDIALLKRIREMTGEGYSLEQIRQALTVVSDTPERQEEASSTLSLIPTLSAELDRLDSGYHQVLSELERLRAERQLDNERITELEARLEALNLPWWKRLFSQK